LSSGAGPPVARAMLGPRERSRRLDSETSSAGVVDAILVLFLVLQGWPCPCFTGATKEPAAPVANPDVGASACSLLGAMGLAGWRLTKGEAERS
jgi:hypothetical protein